MGKRDALHVPVLLTQVLGVLAPKPGQTIVDCTLGLGGHSAAILERIKPDGRLIAIDLDTENIADARVQLQRVKGRDGTVQFDLVHDNFSNLPAILERLGVAAGSVDGVLADIGIASTQIDNPDRGFSYRKPGPLDMRMDPSRGEPASALINRMTQQELIDALLKYGDETDAPKIAKLIVSRRQAAPITTTEQLMSIVCEARDFTIQRAAGAKLHPAARTFQALRIMVNTELDNLSSLLACIPRVLKPGGMAAIITFHSGEDRKVKHSFRDLFRAGVYAADGRDPIIATEDEIKANPRSRSAKLRWARLAGGTSPCERTGFR
ncbi:MAG: 16S rRNA (cytosine(1402)-N(4))-methyltransferase RsmH [Planctomycetes bacterium]|nr:16S rRNA (cytosine(1402)-N(4))-methyltransferase RsmH [Planctomycetota bacterium]